MENLADESYCSSYVVVTSLAYQLSLNTRRILPRIEVVDIFFLENIRNYLIARLITGWYHNEVCNDLQAGAVVSGSLRSIVIIKVAAVWPISRASQFLYSRFDPALPPDPPASPMT
jgi:hypothetical protein